MKFLIEIDTDLLSDYDFVRHFIRLYNLSLFNVEGRKQDDVLERCGYFFELFNPIMVSMIDRDMRNFNKRIKRLKTRTQFIFNYPSATFLTLTIADEYINSYNLRQWKRHVTDCLNLHFDYYIANVDYGTQNGRLHFHAIVNDSFKRDWWKFGSVHFQRVRNNTKDVYKVACYTAKLVNHAVKESVNDNKVMYSRNFANIGI